MKRILEMGALLFCAITMVGNAAAQLPVLIGHFSNQKTSGGDDPHILSGYRVNIYRDGREYFGDIGIGVGASEPEKALLYDIKLDQNSKKLRFKAKFSPGLEFRKGIGSDGREARAILVFSGKLNERSLSGTVTLVDGYQPQSSSTRVSIVLKKDDDDYVPETYEEWRTLIAPPLNNW